MSNSVPRLVITPGEPAGIGPDLCLSVLGQPLACECVVIANQSCLAERAKALGLAVSFKAFTPHQARQPHSPGCISIINVPLTENVIPGKLSLHNADYVLQTLEQAVTLCQAEPNTALVTGPVHKGNLQEAGIDFTGHTELLRDLTQSPQVVMLFANSKMRVALATTHLPLAKVPMNITQEGLIATLTVLSQNLRTHFSIDNPNIAVCGLNPHAGESGYLGHEDQDVIAPAIAHLQHQGLAINGPFPSDTVFLPQNLAHYDAVLAMYHDQGLPVIKYAGFGDTANITLGLPFIRTSVDHGTALTLAGSGQADPSGFESAINYALTMLATSSLNEQVTT